MVEVHPLLSPDAKRRGAYQVSGRHPPNRRPRNLHLSLDVRAPQRAMTRSDCIGRQRKIVWCPSLQQSVVLLNTVLLPKQPCPREA